ncbi:ATP-binding cassette domain-containing protein [Allofranklinella schreckenbergeri]|uniref:ATP-binding cassette domain-containing protein n=1 Tax=Allofranklinella schreckenbergeri TaxID=1076744 RepID=A0A3M6PR93_9BURK|nr:ATP-binding cassette domain-containing protein [Allofranklinella schreckenbergeri]RMW93136.1 ATP-binding cassette domain-containing protein [Allofranklinella schreckenbergeri]RMW99066.1 ATP-binding cassette domain-containing protein [Allofranklinella schreckenbergeri]RMX11026.1 ATP-binding cassette domain-containing protein [Allofranklinella schreckenbergeri]
MLALHAISHRFALEDVLLALDFDLRPGESVALVGPSGCGKSTLMHIIAGLLTPLHGTVDNRFARIGCMFQEPRLLPWRAVLDNIALGLHARGVPPAQRRQQAAALALRMELTPDDLDKYPHELSGGMQSRVALARALAISPDLLLLDEPFSALDIGLRAHMYRLVRSYLAESGCAMLMITHDMMEAVRLASRIAVMAPPGRIVHQHHLPDAWQARDERWIHHQAGELMQTPAVRQSFELV